MPGMGFGFGFGFHRRASGSGASASATLLTLATAAGAEAVYDPDNEETWTLRDDGADLWYSAISDGLGNREDMVQATAADQPKQITLSTGRRAMDVLSQSMLATFSAVITQPDTVFIVLREKTTTNSIRWFDTDGTSARQIMSREGGGWSVWAGAFVTAGTSVDTVWHSFHGIYNGASSELILDGTSIASGDAGTNGLGGSSIKSPAEEGVEAGPIIIFPSAKTAAELSDLRDHIEANWPIGLAA